MRTYAPAATPVVSPLAGADDSAALTRLDPAASHQLPLTTVAASRARQVRARRLLAAGVGLTLSAAVTPSYVLPNREPCWGSDQTRGGPTLKAAAVVGGLGALLTIGGGSWLGVEAHRYGHRASRKQHWIGFGIGAASLLLSQALLGALFFADSICHS